MDSGKAVFVDVRPSHEYEQQHLPGGLPQLLYASGLQRQSCSLANWSCPAFAGQRKSGCFVFAGAVNLPLYRAVETPGFYSNVKRFVMATAFAMTATGMVIVRVATGLQWSSLFAGFSHCIWSPAERNPDFAADAKAALSASEYKGKKLIVYCGMGGTLKVRSCQRPLIDCLSTSVLKSYSTEPRVRTL